MSSVSIPNPSTPPQSPMVDEEARRRRQIEEDQAIAEAKSSGRGSTIIAGAHIARDVAVGRRAAKRAASADLS